MYLAVALIVAACGVEEIGRRPVVNRDDVWVGPGADVESDSRDVCYVTGFEYPLEYDWRTDPEKGSVKCSLVVFADGLPMMKVPVGDTYEVSSDPDMHRMIAGHLYTDYSTDTETVIKKDGVTILRYPGREMICGILVENDTTVYTLGQFRHGEGFAFRRNGEIILERSSGRTYGRLQGDEGRVSFAFVEPVISDKDVIERYYHYTDGQVIQTALRDDVIKVWDIVSYKGGICYLASLLGVDYPVLFQNDMMSAMAMPDGASPLSLRILCDDEYLFCEGLFTSPDVTMASALWFSPGQCVAFAEGMVANSCCISGDSICCAFNPSSLGGVIYRGGEEFSIPAGYAVMGANCGAVANGMLYFGLSSLTGARPKIWRDGNMEILDLCGYIASVSSY